MSKKEWDAIMAENIERTKEEIAEILKKDESNKNSATQRIEGGNVCSRRMTKEEAEYIRAHAKKY